MQDAYIYTAMSALLVAGILMFLYWPWQKLCEDIARQKLFEIRDDLFMLAAEGKFAFDDEAYLTIRRYLEMTIRYAHQLSWMSLVGYSFIIPREMLLHPRDPLGDAVEAIQDPELRAIISKYKDETEIVMFGLIIARSPLLIILSIISGLVLAAVSIIKKGFASSIVQVIAAEAVSLALYDVDQSERAGVPVRAYL